MKIKPPTQDEIRLDDLKAEKAEVDTKLLDLKNQLENTMKINKPCSLA